MKMENDCQFFVTGWQQQTCVLDFLSRMKNVKNGLYSATFFASNEEISTHF
jgi:hypothetical protein